MIGQHTGQGEKVLWGSRVSLGRGDRALAWAGGSLLTALLSALAQAAEIICLLRDLGLGSNDLLPLPTTWVQLPR